MVKRLIFNTFRSYPDPGNPNERKELVVKLRKISVFIFPSPPLYRPVSQDPGNYKDAPTEGIRRVLEIATGKEIPRGSVLEASKIGVCISH